MTEEYGNNEELVRETDGVSRVSQQSAPRKARFTGLSIAGLKENITLRRINSKIKKYNEEFEKLRKLALGINEGRNNLEKVDEKDEAKYADVYAGVVKDIVKYNAHAERLAKLGVKVLAYDEDIQKITMEKENQAKAIRVPAFLIGPLKLLSKAGREQAKLEKEVKAEKRALEEKMIDNIVANANDAIGAIQNDMNIMDAIEMTDINKSQESVVTGQETINKMVNATVDSQKMKAIGPVAEISREELKDFKGITGWELAEAVKKALLNNKGKYTENESEVKNEEEPEVPKLTDDVVKENVPTEPAVDPESVKQDVPAEPAVDPEIMKKQAINEEIANMANQKYGVKEIEDTPVEEVKTEEDKVELEEDSYSEKMKKTIDEIEKIKHQMDRLENLLGEERAKKQLEIMQAKIDQLLDDINEITKSELVDVKEDKEVGNVSEVPTVEQVEEQQSVVAEEDADDFVVEYIPTVENNASQQWWETISQAGVLDGDYANIEEQNRDAFIAVDKAEREDRHLAMQIRLANDEGRKRAILDAYGLKEVPVEWLDEVKSANVEFYNKIYDNYLTTKREELRGLGAAEEGSSLKR